VLPVKAVAVAVAPVVVKVEDKLAPKAAQAARAMARPHRVVEVLRKAPAVIDKIDLKEVLMAHHQSVSTTATMTDAMTVVPAAMSCPVTLTPS
jgi:uncharacterized Zn finger protein